MEKMALILSNFASPEAARSVVRILMQEQIITCANIYQPHFSIYPWQGKVVEENETAALFKGPWAKKDQIAARLRELHPYELPGIIVIDAEANADYVAWLKGE
jgi:periplasmic divalent cation tolerance protein